jgi:hypothetical protein
VPTPFTVTATAVLDGRTVTGQAAAVLADEPPHRHRCRPGLAAEELERILEFARTAEHHAAVLRRELDKELERLRHEPPFRWFEGEGM